MLLADSPSRATIEEYIDALMPQIYATEPIATMGGTNIPVQSQLTRAQVAGLLKGIAGRETNFIPFGGYYLNKAVCPWMLNGWPTISADGGFGLYQLTDGQFMAGNAGSNPNPEPTYSQVWNWKKNMEGALYLISNLKVGAHFKDVNDNIKNYPNISTSIFYMQPNEFLRDLLARYNGGSYFVFQTERLDQVNNNPIDVSTIGPGNRIYTYSNGSPRYAIQFPVTDYYRDLRFCDHRNTGVGDETNPGIPDNHIQFCSSSIEPSENMGFGIVGITGILSISSTGKICRGSSTCYADRRDYNEPQFNPGTPPVRYGIHVLP